MQVAQVDLEWTDITLNKNPNFLKIIVQEININKSNEDYQIDQNIGQFAQQQSHHQISLFVPLEYAPPNLSQPEQGILNRSYQQTKGIADHSNFYLRLVNTRQHEKDLCLEQLRAEQNSRDLKINYTKKREQQSQALQNLIREMSIFNQPVINLNQTFKQFQQIQNQIKQKKVSEQLSTMINPNQQIIFYSPYLKDEWFQVNYVILISLFQHIKYGQDIMHLLLNKNPTNNQFEISQTDMNLKILDEILLYSYILKLKNLEENIIKYQMIPMINKDNVIRYTQLCLLVLEHGKFRQNLFEQYVVLKVENKDDNFCDQYECESQTSLDKEIDMWQEFYKHCQNVICKNILHILQYQLTQFFEIKYFLEPNQTNDLTEEQELALKFGKLTKEQIYIIQNLQDDPQYSLKDCTNLCERLLYRCIYENWINQQSFDFSPIIHALCKIKGINSIFKLLKSEKEKLYGQYLKMQEYSGQNILASHEWKFDKLDRSMYKNDDPFIHNNAVWRLGVTYYRQKDATMKINLNLATNPFQDKVCKIYYKKNEFFLPSNSQLNNHVEDYFILPKDFEGKSQIEKQNILQMKEIVENTLKLYPQHNFMSFIAAIKINNEQYMDAVVSNLIVSSKSPCVVAKIKCFMIEDYIELDDPGVSFLDLEDFRLLLKHKRLHVISEDDICTSLFLWAQNPINNQDSISQIISDVNWNYVSLPCLLNLLKHSQQLRQNQDFHQIIQKEFQMRLKFNENPSQKIEEPRFCYKYFKSQQSYQMITQDMQNQYQENDQYESKNQVIKNNINFWNELIYNLLNPINVLPFQVLFNPMFLNDNNHEFLCSDNFLQNLHLITRDQAIYTSLYLDLNNQNKNNSQIKNQNCVFIQNVQNLLIQKQKEIDVIKERMIDMGINSSIGKSEEELGQFELKQLMIERQKQLENLKADQYKDTLEQQKHFQNQILLIEFDIQKEKKLTELASLQMLTQQKKNSNIDQNKLQFSKFGKKNFYDNHLQKLINDKKVNKRVLKKFTQLKDISQFLQKSQKKASSQKIKKNLFDIFESKFKNNLEKKEIQKKKLVNVFVQKVDAMVQTEFQKEVQDLGSQCNIITESIIQIQKSRIDELQQDLLKTQFSPDDDCINQSDEKSNQLYQNLKNNKAIQLNLSKIFEGKESSINSRINNQSFSMILNEEMKNRLSNIEKEQSKIYTPITKNARPTIPKITMKSSKKSLQQYLHNNFTQNEQYSNEKTNENEYINEGKNNLKYLNLCQSEPYINENILNTYTQMDQNQIFDFCTNKIRQPADHLSDLESIDDDIIHSQQANKPMDKSQTQRQCNSQNNSVFLQYQNNILNATNQIKQQLQTYRIFSQMDKNQLNQNNLQQVEQSLSDQKLLLQESLNQKNELVNKSKFVKQNAELISLDAFGDDFLQQIVLNELDINESKIFQRNHRKNNSFVAFQKLLQPLNDDQIDNNQMEGNGIITPQGNQNKHFELNDIFNVFEKLSQPNVFKQISPQVSKNYNESQFPSQFVSKTIDDSFGPNASIEKVIENQRQQNQQTTNQIIILNNQQNIQSNKKFDRLSKSLELNKSQNSQMSDYQIQSNSNESQIIQQSEKYNLNIRQNLIVNQVILNKVQLDQQFLNQQNQFKLLEPSPQDDSDYNQQIAQIKIENFDEIKIKDLKYFKSANKNLFNSQGLISKILNESMLTSEMKNDNDNDKKIILTKQRSKSIQFQKHYFFNINQTSIKLAQQIKNEDISEKQEKKEQKTEEQSLKSKKEGEKKDLKEDEREKEEKYKTEEQCEADASLSEDSGAYESIMMDGPYSQRAQVIHSNRNSFTFKVDSQISGSKHFNDKIKTKISDIKQREQTIKQQIEENKQFFNQNYGQSVLQNTNHFINKD